MTSGAAAGLRVSAVVPTFNRRRELAAALDSARRQSRPLHEIVVVDDGSTDGTWEALQPLAGGAPGGPRLVLHRQANAGPSAARNAGVRLASGELIAFLDSDDLWREDKTARQLALFDADPRLALVGCAADILPVFPRRRVVPIGVRQLLFRNYFLTPGVMVKRSVLEEAGGFAEDMHRCEDYELWLRIAMRHRCALLNEVLVDCGGGKAPFGESGLSADLWAVFAAEHEAFRRWRLAGGSAAGYAYAIGVLWLRFARRLAIVGWRQASRARRHPA